MTDTIAEEVRIYMEQNDMRAGSVHAASVVRVLALLGYVIIPLTACQGNSSGAWYLDNVDYQAGEARRDENGNIIQPKEMGR